MQAPDFQLLHWPHDLASWNPLQSSDVLLVDCRTPDTQIREDARHLIRTALKAILAKQFALPEASIRLHQPSGTALQAEIPGHHVHLAISHESGLSIAAISSTRKVGLDLLRVHPMADWANVADLYLGSRQTQHIASQADIPRAFAKAWSEHEARLKCLGLALIEWTPALAQQLALCECYPLALPADYCGCLATAPHVHQTL